MVIFSQCIDCKNYIGKNDDGRQICKAFLNGIPEDVFWNRIDHTKNIENDNGIKFENIENIRHFAGNNAGCFFNAIKYLC